jgi:Homeodomain-like domain
MARILKVSRAAPSRCWLRLEGRLEAGTLFLVMPAPVAPLALSDSDRRQLQQWASAYGTPQQVALRCRIVLAAASGQSENAIAQQRNSNRPTVRLWRTRFAQKGLQGLWEVAPGRGRKATYGREIIQQVIDTTLQSQPQGRTQWSCRCLALG